MTIRDMKLEDYDAVDTLMQQLHKIHVNGRPDLYVEMEHPYSKEELTEKIYNKEVIALAAEEEDRIVGLCIVVIKHRSGMVNMKTAYVDDLVVDQSYQRRGIAKSLFQKAEERAKALGAERMDLTVWSFNENALKFYQSIGMVPQRYILEKPLR